MFTTLGLSVLATWPKAVDNCCGAGTFNGEASELFTAFVAPFTPFCITVPIRMPTKRVSTTSTVDKKRCDRMRSLNDIGESMILPRRKPTNLHYIESAGIGRTPARKAIDFQLLSLRRD